jgi:hypothetical protein
MVAAVALLWLFVNPAPAQLSCLDAPIVLPPIRSRQIDYKIVPSAEKYFVWVPSSYDGSVPYGLVVYVSSFENSTALPPGWESVLTKQKMIFVSPQGAGNSCLTARRCGLALLGALEMKAKYKIDERRIFAAGVSGGARTASDLGFFQSDVFRGTIQDCGSNFYRKVARNASNNWVDSEGNTYGVLAATAEEVSRAKKSTRFCLITGPGDFRRGNLIDIYNDGFLREGFQARLFDIPTMGHQDCDAATLEKVFEYLVR